MTSSASHATTTQGPRLRKTSAGWRQRGRVGHPRGEITARDAASATTGGQVLPILRHITIVSPFAVGSRRHPARTS